jgi:hypothetical protein
MADRKPILRLLIKEVIVDRSRARGKAWFQINWQTSAIIEHLQVPGYPFSSLRPAPREPWGTCLGEAMALAREAAVAKQLPS